MPSWRGNADLPVKGRRQGTERSLRKRPGRILLDDMLLFKKYLYQIYYQRGTRAEFRKETAWQRMLANPGAPGRELRRLSGDKLNV